MGIRSWFSSIFKIGKKADVVQKYDVSRKVTQTKSWVANGVTNTIVDVRDAVPIASKAVAKTGGRVLSRGAIGFRSIIKYAAGGAIFVWAYSALNKTTQTMSEITGIPQEYMTLILIVLGIVIIAYLLTLITGVRRKTGLTRRRY